MYKLVIALLVKMHINIGLRQRCENGKENTNC